MGFIALLLIVPALLNYAALSQESRMLATKAGTLYDIGWRQKLMLHCMGEGLPTAEVTSPPQIGGGCGGGLIAGIIIGVLLAALLLAAIVAAIIFALYKHLSNPATQLKKGEAEGLNGVAKDNPLYVDPSTVEEEVGGTSAAATEA